MLTLKSGTRKASRTHEGAHVLELVADHGYTLKKALEKIGLNSSSFFKWVNTDPAFAQAYESAKHALAHNLFDQMIDIADEETWTMEGVQRNKLRVETRKAYAAKASPKFFGEKVQHEHQHQHAVVLLPPLTPIPIRASQPAQTQAGQVGREKARGAISGENPVRTEVFVRDLTPEVRALAQVEAGEGGPPDVNSGA
jgi:hypothetical protein